MQLDQPIVALASAAGPAGRGIIRISGGGLNVVLDRFQDCQGRSTRVKSAQRFSGEWVLNFATAVIPCDLWYWPDHRSYAGQPTIELHVPGSPSLLEKVLEELHQLGIRAARPGEFTLRAFLNGKIDLVQAEAVLGVIDAQNDSELQTALTQLAGGISRRLLDLRQQMLELLTDLEAGLDFVDEDISFVSRAEVRSRLGQAATFVASLLTQTDSRMTSTALRRVVLAGLPNAGKSTLFNRLAGSSLALVSPEQGTTTDYLRARILERGIHYELVDTAGWEGTATGILAAAQSHRSEQLEQADLILWCSAADVDEDQRNFDNQSWDATAGLSIPRLRIMTKSDMVRQGHQPRKGDAESISISVHQGQGINTLRDAITRQLSVPHTEKHAWLGTTAARCRDSLQHAWTALSHAETAANDECLGDELIAVDLRQALDNLGEVAGAVYTDDLLDRIFSKFCIGK